MLAIKSWLNNTKKQLVVWPGVKKNFVAIASHAYITERPVIKYLLPTGITISKLAVNVMNYRIDFTRHKHNCIEHDTAFKSGIHIMHKICM